MVTLIYKIIRSNQLDVVIFLNAGKSGRLLLTKFGRTQFRFDSGGVHPKA